MIQLPENSLLIASKNPGKIKEFKLLLDPLGISVKSALDFDMPESPEDFHTFEENAAQKANYYHGHTGLWSLADDSGLLIDELGGWPGVHTREFADPTDNFAAIRKRLLTPNPTACMVCVLALKTDQDIFYFKGETRGHLVFPPRGGGFGVDPIFEPLDQTCSPFKTFGEDLNLKNIISHRIRALDEFLGHMRG